MQKKETSDTMTSIQQNNQSYQFKPSPKFSCRVFNTNVMKQMLSEDVYQNLLGAIDSTQQLNAKYAEIIANALKEWAQGHGATHFAHWFQPITGLTGEKHESFIDKSSGGDIIDNLSVARLFQAEISGSAFPSGGLRDTSKSRGYTIWDASTPPFLWKSGSSLILCIPSVYVSWTGEALGNRLPLLRSEKKLADAVNRLLKILNIPAGQAHSTLGCEQEYFLIRKDLFDQRPDLVLLGQTLFGSSLCQKKDLITDFFAPVSDKVLAYMKEFENAALELGIPVKTRHNEQAPSQYEVTTLYERSPLSVDHNILLMQTMQQIAARHNLECIFHEKPFYGFYGSGKHCNWSLMTDTGINLLNPKSILDENGLVFVILITSVLCAVQKHAALLRACVGSPANDTRFGADAAPPSIISVDLGESLEKILDGIEHNGSYQELPIAIHDLGLTFLPKLYRDDSDRNRTSVFAFTGDRFEYRAVGASVSSSLPTTVINVIVAESLNEILDEIEQHCNLAKPSTAQDVLSTTMPIIQKHLKASKNIRYAGNHYSKEWLQEAKQRGLASFQNSVEAFSAFTQEVSHQAFDGVLTARELQSRYEVMIEHYVKTSKLKLGLMLEMVRTHIIPAVRSYQQQLATTITAINIAHAQISTDAQKKKLEEISNIADQVLTTADKLEEKRVALASQTTQGCAQEYATTIEIMAKTLRTSVDKLETLIDANLWPFTTYSDLLFKK